MRFLLVVALLAWARAAGAEPPACPAKGTPLLEIHHVVEGSHESSIVKLYESGALVIDATTAEGKPAHSGSGCLDKQRLDQVKDDLAKSPWKVTHADFTCKAFSPKLTIYYLHGKKRYTKRLCGAEILDDVTAKNLDEIERFLK